MWREGSEAFCHDEKMGTGVSFSFIFFDPEARMTRIYSKYNVVIGIYG